MKLVVTIDKKHKVRNSMAALIIQYAQGYEVAEAHSLEWARDKILAQVIYIEQRKMGRGKLTIGEPRVCGRIIGTNRGRRAFEIIEPGRRTWTISIRETEDRELPVKQAVSA